MASSSCPAVVDEKHCHDEELKLEMKEEWWTASGGFVIKDIQGKEYFQVKIYDNFCKPGYSLDDRLKTSKNFWLGRILLT